MKVLMIAPPGAGKGTQGVVIAKHFGVPHVATGDLLRDHVSRGTDLGQSVQGFLDRGELVPDEVVLEMVRDAFVAAKGGGYVLDGIPRTMEQARLLYELGVELGMTADVALHLQVEDDELVRRLAARGAAQGRSDDNEEAIRPRLALYHKQTEPLKAYYGERGLLRSVDGALGSPAEVFEKILSIL